MRCEKCWTDAYYRKLSDPRKTQTEHYGDLLIERDVNPCSPKKQASDVELHYHDAIDNAQREHPDEMHCSCVPLLKMRIKELEDGIEKHRDVPFSKVPWDEELYKLVEKELER